MSDDPIFGMEVARALARVLDNETALARIEILRRMLPAELASRAAELHELRRRALSRFGEKELAFLTPKGLKQASAPAVARARASRVRERGASTPSAMVLDATCGLGSDSLALAASGLDVLAADRDPKLVRYARANFEARSLPAAFLCADAERPAARADFLLVDPDRRPSGKRVLDPEAWSPKLSRLIEVAGRFAGACIELHPAFDPGQLPPGIPNPQLEWIGRGRELAAVDLWTGDLGCAGAEYERSVRVLHGDGGTSTFAANPCPARPLEPDEIEAAGWLADPHSALVRSGLLGALAAREELRPVAPRCAYLLGERAPTSRLLDAWPILGQSSLDRRRLRQLLARHDIGPLQVRKRGHPDRAEVLARRLAGPGSLRGHLAIARLESGHRAFLLGEPATRADLPGGR